MKENTYSKQFVDDSIKMEADSFVSKPNFGTTYKDSDSYMRITNFMWIDFLAHTY